MKTQPLTTHCLLHAADLVEDDLRKRLARIDLRPRQARVIDALNRMDGASQIRLAREFGITPASMSTMTARLIDAGFITRQIDPNETRRHMLRLTDRGRDLLLDIHATWRDVDAMIAERIGSEGGEMLHRLTRDLRDSLGGRAPGAAREAPASDELENSA